MSEATRKWLWGCLGMLFVTSFAWAESGWDGLLECVPGRANTLVTIHVEKLLASPTALLEGTKKKMAFRFAEGAIALPPDAKRVVMASQMDFRRMQPLWEVCVMDVDEYWAMDKLARSARGYLDNLGDVEAVWSPYNEYLVKLGAFRFGAMAPANRQYVSRWVNGERSMALSPYLQHAARYAVEGDTEVVVALDLQYAVDPDRLWMRLPRLRSLQGREYDRERLHKLLQSTRGVTIGIHFGSRPYGKLKVDFGQDTYALSDFAKPLLLELIEVAGAGIDGTDDWEVRVMPRTATLSGYLSDSVRRRLATIIELRPPSQSPLEEPGAGKGLDMGEATRQQYRFVTILLRDLKVQAKEPGRFQALNAWLDNYARRIEELPVENIDGEFLKYRFDVVARIRRMAEDIRYGNVPGYSRQTYRSEYSSLGPYTDAQVTEETSSVLAEARVINGATQRIAKSLGDRYGLEF